mmetsp:Transcript_69347/g.206512  ORF Transcript_69347/g.206512 Transcript_69347/m.206512 type:complete len:311 (-) Transcript_69347:1180-2112(-)
MQVGARTRNVDANVNNLCHGVDITSRPAAVCSERSTIAPLLHHPRLECLLRLLCEASSLGAGAGHERLHEVRVGHAGREHGLEGRFELALLRVPRLDGLHSDGRSHPEAVVDLAERPLANKPHESHVLKGRAGRLNGGHCIHRVAPELPGFTIRADLPPFVAESAAVRGYLRALPARERQPRRSVRGWCACARGRSRWLWPGRRIWSGSLGRPHRVHEVQAARDVCQCSRRAARLTLWQRADGRSSGVQRQLRRHEAADDGHALLPRAVGPHGRDHAPQRKGHGVRLAPVELDLLDELRRRLTHQLQPAE